MEKIALVIIVLLIIGAGFLSGCEQTPNDEGPSGTLKKYTVELKVGEKNDIPNINYSFIYKGYGPEDGYGPDVHIIRLTDSHGISYNVTFGTNDAMWTTYDILWIKYLEGSLDSAKFEVSYKY